MSEDLRFSILIPTYNGANVLKDTLRSILSQSYTNYNIIINDDASNDNIEELVSSFGDGRIKFYKNETNLGYPLNLEECRKKADGDIIYLMGQDDILGSDALLHTYQAFKLSDEIGAVTRPYYWFDKDIRKPVRIKEQLNPNRNEIVTITDDIKRIILVFRTLDQLSGLAYRKKFMDLPFHEDIFPCHVYPFASIFKKHPIVFLKDYNVAVRISTSQTRSLSSIYEKSVNKSWIDMFNNVFAEKDFEKVRNYCVKEFMGTNYVGLVQIRNYGRYRYLLREIYYLFKYRKENMGDPRFWFFSVGCMVMPRSVLIPLVDIYKNELNSRLIKPISFEYKL